MSKEDSREMFYGANSSTFKTAALLRKHMTNEETLVWCAIRDRQPGYKFRRQHPAGKYILDFYFHELRIALEIDGGYHQVMSQRIIDEHRTQDLNSYGIHVIRIPNNDVVKNLSDLGHFIALHILKVKSNTST